jgi:hypothetical protein
MSVIYTTRIWGSKQRFKSNVHQRSNVQLSGWQNLGWCPSERTVSNVCICEQRSLGPPIPLVVPCYHSGAPKALNSTVPDAQKGIISIRKDGVDRNSAKKRIVRLWNC